MSEWTAPIVPVLKSDQTSVVICQDFRITNEVVEQDLYPIIGKCNGYIDNILISGATDKEPLYPLNEIFNHFENVGLLLSRIRHS